MAKFKIENIIRDFKQPVLSQRKIKLPNRQIKDNNITLGSHGLLENIVLNPVFASNMLKMHKVALTNRESRAQVIFSLDRSKESQYSIDIAEPMIGDISSCGYDLKKNFEASAVDHLPLVDIHNHPRVTSNDLMTTFSSSDMSSMPMFGLSGLALVPGHGLFEKPNELFLVLSQLRSGKYVGNGIRLDKDILTLVESRFKRGSSPDDYYHALMLAYSDTISRYGWVSIVVRFAFNDKRSAMVTYEREKFSEIGEHIEKYYKEVIEEIKTYGTRQIRVARNAGRYFIVHKEFDENLDIVVSEKTPDQEIIYSYIYKQCSSLRMLAKDIDVSEDILKSLVLNGKLIPDHIEESIEKPGEVLVFFKNSAAIKENVLKSLGCDKKVYSLNDIFILLDIDLMEKGEIFMDILDEMIEKNKLIAIYRFDGRVSIRDTDYTILKKAYKHAIKGLKFHKD